MIANALEELLVHREKRTNMPKVVYFREFYGNVHHPHIPRQVLSPLPEFGEMIVSATHTVAERRENSWVVGSKKRTNRAGKKLEVVRMQILIVIIIVGEELHRV